MRLHVATVMAALPASGCADSRSNAGAPDASDHLAPYTSGFEAVALSTQHTPIHFASGVAQHTLSAQQCSTPRWGTTSSTCAGCGNEDEDEDVSRGRGRIATGGRQLVSS
jgi:hypothetical protein